MPTTTYTDPTFAVNAIASRTDAAGGAVVDFTAEEVRLLAQILSSGYIKAPAFRVAAQGTPNMSVVVGSGSAKADHYVLTGSVAGQGNYVVRLDAASVTVALAAADASQPRTDEVYLVVQDNAYDASARGLPRLAYRRGDLGGANPGPDAAWRASALLARIPVAAAATSITNGIISDQRSAAGFSPAGKLALVLTSFADGALSARQSGDTVDRFSLRADGFAEWGPGGGAALDTNLYREAASRLRTDDALAVAMRLYLGPGLDASFYRVLAGIIKTDTSLAVGDELFMDKATAGVTFGGGGQPTRIWRVAADTLKVDSNWWTLGSQFIDGGLFGVGKNIGRNKFQESDQTVGPAGPLTNCAVYLEPNTRYILEGNVSLLTIDDGGTGAMKRIALDLPAGAIGEWGLSTSGFSSNAAGGTTLDVPTGKGTFTGAIFTGGTGGFLTVRASIAIGTANFRAYSWVRVTRA